MAKRVADSDDSEWVKDQEPEIVEIELKDTGWPTTQVVLMKDLKLNMDGAVTGIRYTWNGAGTVVDVDNRDLPAMLSKARKTSCCGTVPTPYFTIIGG